MAEFVMKCPHCQAELAAAEEWRGMEVECPTCQKTFTVPARQREAFEAKPVSPSSPGSAEEAAGNGGTFTFICPACEAVAELPAALLGKKYECQKCFEESIAQATTERQCPICGQTIKYHAAICKFCKTDLTKLPPETGKAKPAEEEKFIFICPECDSVAELPLSMKGRNYECKMCCETTVAEPAEERKCPSCGEKIKIKATVCKHCKKPAPPLTPTPVSAKRNDGPQTALSGLQTALSGLQTALSGLFGKNFADFSGGDWCISEQKAAQIHKLFWWWVSSLASIFLAFVMVFWIPVAGLVLIYASGGAFIVLHAIHLYKLWKLVPASEAVMNPLVMVLLLFVPVISYFWIFVAYYGLGKRYDKFIKGTSTKALEYCILFWSFMILGPIALLFPNTIFAVIVFVVMLLAFVVFISMMYRFTRCIDKMPRI